jgi:hypothetical protein
MEWISVKDRLPIGEEEYLVWPHNKYAGVTGQFWPYDDFKDLVKNTFNDKDGQLLHVTHWQVLPDGPS